MQPANPRAPRAFGTLILICALGGLIPLALARGESRSTAPSLTIFFSSERQSQIEPCGCIQKQLGGVQFERALYDREPRETSLRVDAGGFSSRIHHPEDAMRTRYALEAMTDELELDAINVAARDLLLGRTWFETLEEEVPGAKERLVSANIYGDAELTERSFEAYRLVERELSDGTKVRTLITGIAAPDPTARRSRDEGLPGYFLRPADEALRDVMATAPEHDLALVLAYADPETVETVAEGAHTIDCVIRGAGFAAMPGSDSEDAAPLLQHQGSEGKYLGKARAVREADGSWSVGEDVAWLEVSPELEPAPALVDLIESYKQNTQEMMIQQPRGLKQIYAGARSCASCHVSEYEQWKETRHAHALQTLVEKGMQYDSRCLKCHTVGFAQENGFYNVRESMPMANVQCESCHGPAAEHASLQYYLRAREGKAEETEAFQERKRRAAEVMPSRVVRAETCLKCHTPENDDHFVYEEKVRRVNHREAG